MEATAVAGGGGGPAPFLIKTYEMVDDSSTDDMVSWSPASNTSFVVWNPADFAANLLPTYFKHNNFSSFIRQLNTYGFRKIDPERWEFANEDFIKDHKHLLKNIHRRKPIHSHSTHPPGSGSGSSSGASALLLADSERIALEEEIDRLSREKVALTADLWRFTQQQSGTKNQLEDMERRLYDMEQRQAKMIAFLETALRNPRFVHNLIKMTGGSGDPAAVATDFSIILHKKRRLPGDCFLDIATTAAERSSSFYDISSNNSSCSSAAASNMMADTGQVFNQDFCDKLSLGLYPAAVSESNNLVTPSIQSSGSSREEHNSNGNGRLECLSFVPDTLELSDTGTSLCPRKDSFFSRPVDDGDGLISFHLNLTLASSAMQIDKSDTLSRTQNSVPEEAIGDKEEEEEEEEEDTDKEVATENETSAAAAADRSENARPLKEATTQTSNQGPPGAPGRVNDLFWEQFLTERPGSSDAEEASSSLREDPSDDSQEERKVGDDNGMWKNSKDMEKLTL